MALILLVDDNEDFRRAAGLALTKAGHQVQTASNGIEAVRQFTQSPVDLVITDLIMPDQEGLETIQALKRTKPSVRIIAVSGGGRNAPANYLTMAGLLGACRTLPKPCHPSELLHAVDSALARS
ncbi:MAG: response regulator [Verrucomicrobiota bacterium]